MKVLVNDEFKCCIEKKIKILKCSLGGKDVFLQFSKVGKKTQTNLLITHTALKYDCLVPKNANTGPA